MVVLVAMAALGLLRRRLAALFLLAATLFRRSGTIEQLHQRHRGSIAIADPELDDPRIPPVALLEAGGDLGEELLDHGGSLQHRRGAAPGVERAPLSERDHPIRPAAQLLGLRIRRTDRLVLQKRRDQIAEERTPVRRRAVQLHPCDAMPHAQAVSFSRSRRRRSSSSRGGKFSSRIPRPRPISRRMSLISLSDLRPKFLVLSISCSVRWMSSPM